MMRALSGPPSATQVWEVLAREWPALGIWVLAVFGFGWQALAQEGIGRGLPAMGIFTLLMTAYLGSVFLPAEGARRWAGADVRRVYGVPFALWFAGALLGTLGGLPTDPPALFGGLAFLVWPTALVLHNRAAWGPIPALVILGTLALILIPGPPPADPVGWAFRIGAGLWPLPLILGWPAATRPRAHLLYFGAVLFVWYAVEFDRLPALPLLHGGPSYFHLAAIPLFLWLMLLSGRLPDLGLTFRWAGRDVLSILVHLAGFAAFALPFGWLTGFLTPASTRLGLPEALLRLLAIYLFIALPEEILFRGALHVHLQRALGWPPLRVLLLSSLLFGLAHLNNPPKVGLYAILAAVAGFFYGRTYLQTGKVTTAALVHALVDWVWGLLFSR
ncbi:MAG: CPBP family intramembrane metalloprotease [Thermoflexus sp.]|jgi:membrane protease YdiL (CAAX protease family)|nr:CPBP family intramembrane metalloprotease [Thermoflexus sp.]